MKKKRQKNKVYKKPAICRFFCYNILMYNSVQFEDEKYSSSRKNIRKKGESELINWLIKKGWIKNKNIAGIVLIIISILFMFLAFVFFTGGEVFGSNNNLNRSNQPYFIHIPGELEPVEIMPGEDVSEVIKRYRN